MKHVRGIAAAAGVLLMTGCTDYATFVTATNIGISADTTTQDLSIGFTRAELFAGPGYPQQGEALSAVGFIHSDLSIQPHIQQLYATGDAATAVTAPPSVPPPRPPATLVPNPPPTDGFYGERRPLVFGTGTNFGLKVAFSGGTAPAPSSFKLGYNREEASIIPLRHDPPTADNRDRYAPVLASIDLDTVTKTVPDTKAGLTQFFATGAAAKNLAKQRHIQEIFEDKASEAMTKLTERYSYNDLSREIEVFWKPGGIINPAHGKLIKDCMDKNKIDGTIYEIIRGKPDEEKQQVITCLQI